MIEFETIAMPAIIEWFQQAGDPMKTPQQHLKH